MTETLRSPRKTAAPLPSLTIPRYTLAVTAIVLLAAVTAIHVLAPRQLPSDPSARIDRLLEAGLPETVDDLFERLLRDKPLDPDLNYRYVTQHYRDRRDPSRTDDDRRIESRYAAMAASPGADGDQGRYSLGLIEGMRKNWDGALAHYASVVNRDLKYLNNSTGRAWLEKGDAVRAEAACRREIELGGHVPGAVSNLVELYLKRGETAKARALARDPRSAPFVPVGAKRTIALRSGRLLEYLKWTFVAPLHVSLGAAASTSLICLLWCFYLWRIDLFQQEPWPVALAVLAAGAVSAPATGLLHDLVAAVAPFREGSLAYFCVLVGLVEETAKLIPVLILAATTRQIDEPVDLLIYGSLSALGFATLENAMYFTGYGEGIVFARFLVSTVIHLSMTSVVCYAWASARWIRPRKVIPAVLGGLAIASVLHGVFDWASLTPVAGMSIVSVLILIVIAGVYGRMLVNTLDFSPYYDTSFAASSRLHNYQLLAAGGLIFLFVVFLHDHFRFSTQIADHRAARTVRAFWLPMLAVFGGLGELGLRKGVLLPLLRRRRA